MKAIYTNPDGSVSVIIPAHDAIYLEMSYRILDLDDTSLLTAAEVEALGLKISREVVEWWGENSLTAAQSNELMQAVISEIHEKDSPEGITPDAIDDADLPADRMFRNAWVKDGAGVKTDLPKAKEITHVKRRAHRDELFAPLDVQVTIPAQADKAEADRVIIRDADDELQLQIDGVTTEAALRTVIADSGI